MKDPSARLMDAVEVEYLANPDLPGIYIWEIESIGKYVGKYSSKKRPLSQYARNVHRLLSGRPYRKNNPEGYRHIHTQLANAFTSGKRIKLTFYENVLPNELGKREEELILLMGNLNKTIWGA
jgi:hypothetical protein